MTAPSPDTTTLELRVRFGETDLMGIVHHASYLTYFEAGRIEWLRRRGVTYAEWAGRGIHLPVVEAHVNYHAPARFDDLLCIETTRDVVRMASLKFTYRITRAAAPIATGFTRLACIDAEHKLLRIPDDMRAVLAAPTA